MRWEKLSPHELAAAARRVLNDLDRMDRRLQDFFVRQRKAERVPYRAELTVLAPLDRAEDTPCAYERLQVWSRDISQQGLGFISPRKILSRELIVALPLEGGAISLVQVRITRSREVPGDFWEYGGVFSERLPHDHPAYRRLHGTPASCA